MNRKISMVLTCLCAAVISATALGQATGSGAAAPTADGKKTQGDPRRGGGTVLSGPTVGKSEVDPRRASGQRGAERGRRAMELPPRVWLQAVRNLNLTDEQTAQVDAFVAEHQEAAKKYSTEQGKALADLRAQMREAVQKGEKPEDLRAQLKAIQDKAPKFASVQKKVWDILTPEQQSELRATIEKLRESAGARDQRRGQERDDRRAGAQGPGMGTAAPQGDPRRDRMDKGRPAPGRDSKQAPGRDAKEAPGRDSKQPPQGDSKP